MEHQVFISYSSQDKELADRVCAALEKTGVSCWIAPRDIEAGTDYPNAILQAIKSVKSVVVLLTSGALASPHILSEIGHAFNAKKQMLPVRLCSSLLPPDFDYFLSTQQWLDAPGGFTDETLKRVIDTVSGTLVEQRDLDHAAHRRKRSVLIAAAFAMVLAAAGIVAYSRRPGRPVSEPEVTWVAPSNTTVPPATIVSPQPKIWLNPKDGLKYVWISPGNFTMGCSVADNECRDDEKPAHRVNIPTGFWLSQTEVTNAAYRKVLPAKASDAEGDGALPMRGLSWPESKAYCSATGGRLPTEAEWEYAARGGTAQPYYGVPSKIAWYEKDSDQQTHPVGLKEPNSFGLYDMLGNVSEWVLDRYYNKYDVEADATEAHIDQPLAGNSSAVARGGFWDAELPSIRVSHRSEMPHDERVETTGVRCANDHSAP